ncbi:hypothetical protein DFP72DRAFT_858402 [Ephemerocybe angulata]|uniref:Uncharacterized protein n=1 Tax=Ephemerocybe angulata TaxID=980116 RepID=A0A8H6HB10_9AGAR|nr:hypothetical protein DFP72DRAFT_858402 [Tulosesus angulatus]
MSRSLGDYMLLDNRKGGPLLQVLSISSQKIHTRQIMLTGALILPTNGRIGLWIVSSGGRLDKGNRDLLEQATATCKNFGQSEYLIERNTIPQASHWPPMLEHKWWTSDPFLSWAKPVHEKCHIYHIGRTQKARISPPHGQHSALEPLLGLPALSPTFKSFTHIKYDALSKVFVVSNPFNHFRPEVFSIPQVERIISWNNTTVETRMVPYYTPCGGDIFASAWNLETTTKVRMTHRIDCGDHSESWKIPEDAILENIIFFPCHNVNGHFVDPRLVQLGAYTNSSPVMRSDFIATIHYLLVKRQQENPKYTTIISDTNLNP